MVYFNDRKYYYVYKYAYIKQIFTYKLINRNQNISVM